MTVEENLAEGSVNEETTMITEESDVQLTPEPTEPTGLDALNEKIAKATAEVDATDESPDVETTDDVVKADSEESTWEPTLSYKVRDEEHKMDDWVKDKITSEEDQKMFQELYTRGHGLEIAKKERDDLKGKLTNLDKNLEYLGNAAREGRIGEFLEVLGLPKEQFIKYAMDELKYQNMAPEERAKVDQQRQYEQTQRNLQIQNQQMQQQLATEQTQRLNYEIDTTLNSSEYKDIAQSYDQRVGKPGAFRQLVTERGIFHETVNGRELTVREAIQDAVVLIGGFQAGAPNLSQQAGTVGTQPVQQKTQTKKPVIPSFRGQGTSPTKKMPTSIEDLRNKHRELTGQL